MSICWYDQQGMEKLRRDHELRYELSEIFTCDVKKALKGINIKLEQQVENDLLIKLLGSAYKIFMLGYNNGKVAS